MDLSRLLRSPIEVQHVSAAGAPDDFGDPTEVVVSTTFLGYVWQEATDETTAGGEIPRERWRFAIDRAAAAVLDSGARIVADGLTYDVAGAPWPAKNARTGLVEYVLADLERSV